MRSLPSFYTKTFTSPKPAAERGHSREDEEPYQPQDLGVGSLLEHTRQVAEADAPADEVVPVGVAVKVVVHNLGEAQDNIPKESSVLHHVGICCGDSHQPHQCRLKANQQAPQDELVREAAIGSPNRQGVAQVWSGYTEVLYLPQH